jgi:hypothetical protein
VTPAASGISHTHLLLNNTAAAIHRFYEISKVCFILNNILICVYVKPVYAIQPESQPESQFRWPYRTRHHPYSMPIFYTFYLQCLKCLSNLVTPRTSAYIDRVPHELLDRIVSLALPTRIVVKNPLSPTTPQRNDTTYLSLAHVSRNFRAAMLENPANFTNLTIAMAPTCHDHTEKQISFLMFVTRCAGNRPLTLSITLVNPSGYQDVRTRIHRNGYCPCLALLLQSPIHSLELVARECTTIADFIVMRGLNRRIFTQPQMQHFGIRTTRPAGGWSIVRFLDILATRRFKAAFTMSIPGWISYEATLLRAVLPLISTAHLTCCAQGYQRILPSFPHLQMLILEHSVLTDATFNPQSSPAIALDKLRSISLRINRFPDDRINGIIRSIRAPRLTTVTIEWAHESGSITAAFIQALESMLSHTQMPIRQIRWVESSRAPYVMLDNPSPLHPRLAQMLTRLGLDTSIYQYDWVEI